MAHTDKKAKEINRDFTDENHEYGILPYDDKEFFFNIQKDFDESKKKGQFQSVSFTNFMKKFSKKSKK